MDRFFKKTTADLPAIPAEPVHPYYPLGVEIANYIATDRDVFTMITQFVGGWAVILSITWVITGFISPRLKTVDKLAVIWFVLTGTIHFFFEGYFAYNHTRMGPAQDLFGQLWKEYALSDSRYLTSDPFVLCMETVTAVLWGPLSYLTVYYILKNNSLRYPLQAIVSLGQIYGDILYYATGLFDFYYRGLSYCRPEGYYFWFYYFFFNFIWLVIPGALLYQSCAKTAEAFDAMNRISKSLQGNGAIKSPNGKKHR